VSPPGEVHNASEGGGPERRPGLCAWLVRFLRCSPPEAGGREARVRNRRVHMANERTFLAWLRTSLALMGFGFIVHRFNLFAREIRLLAPARPGAAEVPVGPVLHLGLILMILGSVLGLLAAVRFLIVEHEIETDTYRPSVIFNLSLALVLAALGLFLAVSLWERT
jgi:uncharacterized membrane protein YidH (DUF202 family)